MPLLQETIDGNLAARAFGLLQVLDSPAMQSRRSERSRQRLDLALLSFLQNFRKVYIGEHVMHASKVPPSLSAPCMLSNKCPSPCIDDMLEKLAGAEVFSSIDLHAEPRGSVWVLCTTSACPWCPFQLLKISQGQGETKSNRSLDPPAQGWKCVNGWLIDGEVSCRVPRVTDG